MRYLCWLLLFSSACASGRPLQKFTVLHDRVTVSGIVTWTDGHDLDIQLDAQYYKLIAAFPEFGGKVHCEGYGHAGFPDGKDLPPVAVGERVALSGVLVTDNYVHAPDETSLYPARTATHWLVFESMRPKLELHPYLTGSLVKNPPLPELHPAKIDFDQDFWSPTWLFNRIFGLAWKSRKPVVLDVDL